MRALGVDLGTRRVGLAVSDASGMIASPLCIAKVRSMDDAVEAVCEKVVELSVGIVVVGLARNMSGKLGPKGKECEQFSEKLRARGLVVDMFDERLSTVAAERSLLQADMSRKKRREKLDAVAAQMILQSYLDLKRR